MLQELINALPSKLNDEDDDKWAWKLNGNTDFSVAKLKIAYDHHQLPISINLKTRWNRFVPKKINLFIWRLRRDCLPTIINLFAKGIDITSVNCVDCTNGVQYTNHIFHQCTLVKEINTLLCNWTKLNIPDAPPEQILKWCDELKLPVASHYKLEAILFLWWWHVWKARNNVYHNDVHNSTRDVCNSIISVSYLRIHNRDKKNNSSWDSWNTNPFGC